MSELVFDDHAPLAPGETIVCPDHYLAVLDKRPENGMAKVKFVGGWMTWRDRERFDEHVRESATAVLDADGEPRTP